MSVDIEELTHQAVKALLRNAWETGWAEGRAEANVKWVLEAAARYGHLTETQLAAYRERLRALPPERIPHALDFLLHLLACPEDQRATAAARFLDDRLPPAPS